MKFSHILRPANWLRYRARRNVARRLIGVDHGDGERFEDPDATLDRVRDQLRGTPFLATAAGVFGWFFISPRILGLGTDPAAARSLLQVLVAVSAGLAGLAIPLLVMVAEAGRSRDSDVPAGELWRLTRLKQIMLNVFLALGLLVAVYIATYISPEWTGRLTVGSSLLVLVTLTEVGIASTQVVKLSDPAELRTAWNDELVRQFDHVVYREAVARTAAVEFDRVLVVRGFTHDCIRSPRAAGHSLTSAVVKASGRGWQEISDINVVRIENIARRYRIAQPEFSRVAFPIRLGGLLLFGEVVQMEHVHWVWPLAELAREKFTQCYEVNERTDPLSRSIDFVRQRIEQALVNGDFRRATELINEISSVVRHAGDTIDEMARAVADPPAADGIRFPFVAQLAEALIGLFGVVDRSTSDVDDGLARMWALLWRIAIAADDYTAMRTLAEHAGDLEISVARIADPLRRKRLRDGVARAPWRALQLADVGDIAQRDLAGSDALTQMLGAVARSITIHLRRTAIRGDVEAYEEIVRTHFDAATSWTPRIGSPSAQSPDDIFRFDAEETLRQDTARDTAVLHFQLAVSVSLSWAIYHYSGGRVAPEMIRGALEISRRYIPPAVDHGLIIVRFLEGEFAFPFEDSAQWALELPRGMYSVSMDTWKYGLAFGWMSAAFGPPSADSLLPELPLGLTDVGIGSVIHDATTGLFDRPEQLVAVAAPDWGLSPALIRRRIEAVRDVSENWQRQLRAMYYSWLGREELDSTLIEGFFAKARGAFDDERLIGQLLLALGRVTPIDTAMPQDARRHRTPVRREWFIEGHGDHGTAWASQVGKDAVRSEDLEFAEAILEEQRVPRRATRWSELPSVVREEIGIRRDAGATEIVVLVSTPRVRRSILVTQSARRGRRSQYFLGEIDGASVVSVGRLAEGTAIVAGLDWLGRLDVHPDLESHHVLHQRLDGLTPEQLAHILDENPRFLNEPGEKEIDPADRILRGTSRLIWVLTYGGDFVITNPEAAVIITAREDETDSDAGSV